MRHVAVFVLAAGCSFHTNDVPGDGSDTTTAALIDDTAVDFMQAQTLDGAAIDPGGFVEPAAFVLGGFHARAYDGKHVSAATTSWMDIETEVAGATARGTAYAQLPANWGGARPKNLALTGDDMWTVLYDGELHVPMGDHTISLDADDAGAMEIDQGSGFAGFVVDAAGGAVMVSVHADEDTWMPFHAAVGESTGNAQLVLKLDGTEVTAEQARARASDAHGLLTWIYAGASVLGPVVVDAPSFDWGMTTPPFDLATNTAVTQYTARMLGQIRIDQDGTYTFATATTSNDDSTALYIDRHLVSRTSVLADPHPASATLQLTAGWHAIAIELQGTQKHIFGQADPHAVTLATTIAAGDGPAMPITAAMLRPAATSGYLATSITSAYLNDTLIANGVTAIPLPVATPAPPAGAVIESTVIGYFLTHATPSDYTTVTLDMAGTPLSVPATSTFVYVMGDETAAGVPVPQTAGAWTYTFTDTVSGNASGFADPSAAPFAVYTYHGGSQMPFAQQATYVSTPRELTGITAFGALTATGELDGVTLAVRTAATAEDLATAAWVDVANGAVPSAAALPFVQYRIAFASDGWEDPHVDKLELDYTR
jgi:hypothetical protein